MPDIVLDINTIRVGGIGDKNGAPFDSGTTYRVNPALDKLYLYIFIYLGILKSLVMTNNLLSGSLMAKEILMAHILDSLIPGMHVVEYFCRPMLWQGISKFSWHKTHNPLLPSPLNHFIYMDNK